MEGVEGDTILCDRTFQQDLDPRRGVLTLVSAALLKYSSTMEYRTYTITLNSLDLGQMLDGIEQRAKAYRDTEYYWETGDFLEEMTLVEVRDGEEARRLAEHYERIIATVQAQMVQQDKER